MAVNDLKKPNVKNKKSALNPRVFVDGGYF
jgi:hypothetical protein